MELQNKKSLEAINLYNSIVFYYTLSQNND